MGHPVCASASALLDVAHVKRQPLTRSPAPRQYVAYSTRALRLDYRDRLRVQAVLREATMEHVLNLALGIGLRELERKQ